jgi:hypothetical protein
LDGPVSQEDGAAAEPENCVEIGSRCDRVSDFGSVDAGFGGVGEREEVEEVEETEEGYEIAWEVLHEKGMAVEGEYGGTVRI